MIFVTVYVMGYNSPCHLKGIDSESRITDLGQNHINFPAFLKAAQSAGMNYYYVYIAHDMSAAPLRINKKSYNYLNTISRNPAA